MAKHHEISVHFQARNQDLMWEGGGVGANEAQEDQTAETTGSVAHITACQERNG